MGDLSKCAQALTDEQRNMLLKLDALEAQTKVSFKKHEPAATDECLRRLSFLETEQQNFAVSLKKVLQTTEERLRRSEESANSRFLEVERALRKTGRSDVDAREHVVEDGRQRSNGETPGEQTADLGLRLEQSRESLCELVGAQFGAPDGRLEARVMCDGGAECQVATNDALLRGCGDENLVSRRGRCTPRGSERSYD